MKGTNKQAIIRGLKPGEKYAFADKTPLIDNLANTLRHHACQLGKELGRHYSVHIIRTYGHVIVERHNDKSTTK